MSVFALRGYVGSVRSLRVVAVRLHMAGWMVGRWGAGQREWAAFTGCRGEGSADDSLARPRAGPGIENPKVDLRATGATTCELMGRLGSDRFAIDAAVCLTDSGAE